MNSVLDPVLAGHRIELRLQSIKRFFRQTARIARRFHHQRRYRRQDRSHGDATFTVPRDVTHHLAATGGMADVDRIF